MVTQPLLVMLHRPTKITPPFGQALPQNTITTTASLPLGRGNGSIAAMFTVSRFSRLILTLAGVATFALSQARAEQKLPNILWITSEDNGAHLGCYGDTYATSPNIDRLAKRSLRYTNASSTAPVCAPARTTIISGIYPPATGAEHAQHDPPAEGLKNVPGISA